MRARRISAGEEPKTEEIDALVEFALEQNENLNKCIRALLKASKPAGTKQ